MELEMKTTSRVPVTCRECGQTTKVGAIAKCGICDSNNVRLLGDAERIAALERRVEQLSRAVSMNADAAKLALAEARSACQGAPQ